MCNGHFAEVPLLPVAIVMGSLSQVAGALFLALNGKLTRYRVLSADIAAHRFAEAGKALFLTASLAEIREQVLTFKCEATTMGGLVGEMSISLASEE
jgi:3-hydroxymyristoyl/3-hydroxydecanoyl-(acyl carrier protein) dehydratase